MIATDYSNLDFGYWCLVSGVIKVTKDDQFGDRTIYQRFAEEIKAVMELMNKADTQFSGRKLSRTVARKQNLWK